MKNPPRRKYRFFFFLFLFFYFLSISSNTRFRVFFPSSFSRSTRINSTCCSSFDDERSGSRYTATVVGADIGRVTRVFRPYLREGSFARTIGRAPFRAPRCSFQRRNLLFPSHRNGNNALLKRDLSMGNFISRIASRSTRNKSRNCFEIVPPRHHCVCRSSNYFRSAVSTGSSPSAPMSSLLHCFSHVAHVNYRMISLP